MPPVADVFSKAKRSDVMSRIRSRGNQRTELALAALLRRHGITGWRRHVPLTLAGPKTKDKGQTGNGRVRPDFVFRDVRLALFVDGCFWHGCPRHATQPKDNASFWRKKIAANQARDRRVNRELKRAGWRVLRIWEHALQRATSRRATVKPGARKAGSTSPAGRAGEEGRLVRRIRQALAAGGVR